MKNESQYDSMEEMERCRKEAKIELEKLYEKLGFIIFEVADDVRLEGKNILQKRRYFLNKYKRIQSYSQ